MKIGDLVMHRASVEYGVILDELVACQNPMHLRNGAHRPAIDPASGSCQDKVVGYEVAFGFGRVCRVKAFEVMSPPTTGDREPGESGR